MKEPNGPPISPLPPLELGMTTPKKKPTPAGKIPITPMTDALKQPAPWAKDGQKSANGQVKGQVDGSPSRTPRKGLSGA